MLNLKKSILAYLTAQLFSCNGLGLQHLCTHLTLCVCFQDHNLGDDTVLDKISLREPDQYELPDLSAEEQAIILGVW